MDLNKQQLQESNGYATSFMNKLEFQNIYISPDLKYIVLVLEGEIIVKSKVKTLLKIYDTITQCIFSPNSQYMVIVNDGYFLFLYKCGEEKFQLIYQKASLYKKHFVDFSIDSKNIIVLGQRENPYIDYGFIVIDWETIKNQENSYILTNFETEIKLIHINQPIDCIELSRLFTQGPLGFQYCQRQNYYDDNFINLKIARRQGDAFYFKQIKKIKIPTLFLYEFNFINLIFIWGQKYLRIIEPRTGKLIKNITLRQPADYYHIIYDRHSNQIHESRCKNYVKNVISVDRKQLFPIIQSLPDIDFPFDQNRPREPHKLQDGYYIIRRKKRIDFHKM